MLGPPYQWIGTTKWSFDADLLTDPVLISPLTGLLSLQLFPSAEAGYESDPSTQAYQFTHGWRHNYATNPASTCNIEAPRISALRYDSIFLAAQALQNYFEEKALCNQTSASWLHNCTVDNVLVSSTRADTYYSQTMAKMDSVANRCCVMYIDDHQLATPIVPSPSGYPSREARGYVMNYHVRHAVWNDGVSGIVELDWATGDRLAHYAIVNARGPSYNDTDGLFRIGEFKVTDVTGKGNISLLIAPIWPGNATSAPRDAPLHVIVILTVPDWVIYIFYAITGNPSALL
jgi:hypothetical protein